MLNTKKATQKSKKLAHKLLIIPPAIIVIVLLGIGGALWCRKIIRAKRAEEYARQEAEMKAEVFNFTIIPGDTIMKVKKKLLAAGYSSEEVDTALSATYDNPVLKSKPATASLEGYLYGETYEFYKGDPVTKIIETFLAGTEKIIADNDLEKRFATHGLSLHEGIILASIIQRESTADAHATIAQVLYSRLKYNLPLGVDASISYAIDIVDPDRTTYTNNTAALNIDSCYNTRKYAGLPCGAISNPGLASLLAVASPSDTSYLYFLTGDDGLMYYGNTMAEHERNISTHCQVRCKQSL